jgi:predicted nucleic acid-binding protein
MSLAFFDTNILIYMFESEETEKQRRASALYERHLDEDSVVLSVQVLNEFFAAVTRRAAEKMSISSAVRAVESLARGTVHPLDVDLTFKAIKRAEGSRLNFWDALIVESSLRAKAEVLYTEDLQYGQVIDGLRIENPFRELN